MTDTLLADSLQVAVPLWIAQLRGQDWTTLQARAQECGAVIAHHGDNILYRGKKKGETAAAFNALAEAIAVLAHMPGGVTVFGQHWEAVGV